MSPMVYSDPNGEFTVSIGLGAIFMEVMFK